MKMRNLLSIAFLLLIVTAKAQTCPDANHPHAIDLGLPSGTQWACCNIGAKNPEQGGSYFAYGETKEKDVYCWKNYQYGSRLNIKLDLKHINWKSTLRYNAAHVAWGAPWLMPTPEQFRELVENCEAKWTVVNGVKGKLFTSKNGASIFLPAAGQRNLFSLMQNGTFGHYWTEYSPGEVDAIFFYVSANGANTQSSDLCIGRTVRAVINKE